MFVIFGTSTRNKLLEAYEQDVCGVCHTPNNMQLLEQSYWFSLFFIPIFKVAKKYYLICPNCRASRPVSKEEAKVLLGKAPAKVENGKVRPGAQHPETAVATETTPQTTTAQTAVSVETMIKGDIDKVLASIKDPAVLQDSSNFNRLYTSLKDGLTAKYNNGELVEKTLKEYFNI